MVGVRSCRVRTRQEFGDTGDFLADAWGEIPIDFSMLRGAALGLAIQVLQALRLQSSCPVTQGGMV